MRLLVEDKEVAKGGVARTAAFRYGVEPLDIGRNIVSAVSEEYIALFPFQGRMNQETIKFK